MALNFDNKLSGQQRLTKADLFLMHEHVLHLFQLLRTLWLLRKALQCHCQNYITFEIVI